MRKLKFILILQFGTRISLTVTMNLCIMIIFGMMHIPNTQLLVYPGNKLKPSHIGELSTKISIKEKPEKIYS